jgi:fucose permease
VGTALIGAIALDAEAPWRAVVLSMACFPAIILIGFLWARVPPLVEEGGRAEPTRRLLRSSFFVAALVAIFLGGATEQGMAQWLSTYAQKEMGRTESFGSLLLAGFLLGMAGGRIVAAMVAERVGPFRLMMFAAGLAVALYAAGSFSRNVPAALGACVMIGFAGSCLWPTLLAVTANQYPRGGATMFAMLGAAGNTGCFTMPWLIGVVADQSRISTGLAVAGLCPLVLFGVLLWMGRHARSREVATAPAVE